MSYKIERRDGAEIYASDAGFVFIKQENGVGEESIVAFHPDEIPELIAHLENSMHEAKALREEIAQHGGTEP